MSVGYGKFEIANRAVKLNTPLARGRFHIRCTWPVGLLRLLSTYLRTGVALLLKTIPVLVGRLT